MKKIQILFVILLAATFVNCKGRATLGGGGGGAGGGANANDPTNTNRQYKDISVNCNGAQPATAMGIWLLDQTSGAFSQEIMLNIQDTATTISATCTYKTITRYAPLTVPSHFEKGSYIIDKAGDKKVGDSKLMCEASLPQGVIPYGFKGSCLQIRMNGTVHTYAHVDQ